MSTGERVKILDYLPPEQKQKVLTLVQRLKEETDLKQKYLALYQQSQQQLQNITLKYNHLKDQNKLLKQQIHNSFSMVSQVRANFRANRQRISQQKLKEDEQWSDQSDPQNQENHGNMVNTLSATVQHNQNPRKQALQKYKPPMTTSKKEPPMINFSQTELNKTSMTSSRSKELTDLKNEIKEMQKSKRKQQQKKKQAQQKLRLVDQIKNRYKNGQSSCRKSTDQNKQSIIQRIDITDTFQNEEHKSKEKEKAKKMISVQKKSVQKQHKNVVQNKQRYTSPSKGYMITSQDYDDVLDLINN